MKAKLFSLFLVAASLLLSLSAATSVRAEDLRVAHNGTFTTIQSAINHAALRMQSPTSPSFRILVTADAEPYRGSITPISNVPIIGDNTANTVLENLTGTVIDLNAVSNLEIRNLTFRTASLGISVANSSGIDITNNVFQLGTTGTAIQVQNSPNNTSIVNNTFYNNGTAIRTNSDIEISNNIFVNNTLAISPQTSLALASYNYFFGNTTNGISLDPNSIPNIRVPNQDPRFVNQGQRDFHLQPESAAKGAGNPKYRNSFDSTSDMGAYGGLRSDIELSAPGLTWQFVEPDSIALSWNPSNPPVTAYRVYYGFASRTYNGTQAPEGTSPILVPATSATLTNLPITAPPAPEAPPLTIRPLNQALQLNWDIAPGATGYEIYHSSTVFDASTLPASFIPIQGGSTTSYRLTGLSNGTTYYVAIRAVSQRTVFAAVTAVINSNIAPNQGSANESSYSNETFQVLTPLVKSASSDVANGSPEAITPNPNLPNKGCFIATAAYGFYDAPQVQVLRKFRDSYLMTNAPGRSFVAWYYQHGPRGAAFINAHPWLKLPVRFALLPLIAFAMFLLNTTPLVKLLIVVLAVLCTAHSIKRINVMRKIQTNMLVQSGGQP